MSRKVFDCIMYFQELEILEIRMETLRDVVDYFVIVEANRTHQNNPKDFTLLGSDLLDKWAHKIIYIPLGMPTYNGNPWEFEAFQRNGAMRILYRSAQPDDLVLVGDLDEIPNPDVVSAGVPGVCLQKLSYFWMNYCCHFDWQGTVIIPWSEIATYKDLNMVRFNRTRFTGIPNGGWHCSYLGGVDAIINKIKNFAHGEYNFDYWLDPKRIQQCVDLGCDLYERGGLDRIYHPSPVTSLPLYVQQNADRFKHFLYQS